MRWGVPAATHNFESICALVELCVNAKPMDNNAMSKTVERGKAVPDWIGWVFGILRKMCVMDKGCFSVAPVCYWIARSGPTNLLNAFVLQTDSRSFRTVSRRQRFFFALFCVRPHVWRSKRPCHTRGTLYGDACVCVCVFVAEKWERFSFILSGWRKRARFIFNVDYKWTFLASFCSESPLSTLRLRLVTMLQMVWPLAGQGQWVMATSDMSPIRLWLWMYK